MPEMLEFWRPFLLSKAHGIEVLGLPEGDVTLADGSVLKNYGTVVYGKAANFHHGFKYRGPGNMHVIATSDSTPVGLILHVSVSFPQRDPTRSEIDLLKKSFYPEHINCQVEVEKPDRFQPYSITHIRQAPPKHK